MGIKERGVMHDPGRRKSALPLSIDSANVSVCAGFNSPSWVYAPGKSSERVIHNSVLFTAEGVPSKEIEKMATGGVGECPSHSFILEISN